MSITPKGVWWVGADQKPPVEPAWCCSLAGDPKAWQRNWSQLWRFQWRWHLFEVDLDCCPVDASRGYYVYCHSENDSIRYRFWVRTPYFFARLGPDRVYFWAVNVGRNHYRPLPIKYRGDGGQKKKWIAGNLKRPSSRKLICNWGNAVSI